MDNFKRWRTTNKHVSEFVENVTRVYTELTCCEAIAETNGNRVSLSFGQDQGIRVEVEVNVDNNTYTVHRSDIFQGAYEHWRGVLNLMIEMTNAYTQHVQDALEAIEDVKGYFEYVARNQDELSFASGDKGCWMSYSMDAISSNHEVFANAVVFVTGAYIYDQDPTKIQLINPFNVVIKDPADVEEGVEMALKYMKDTVTFLNKVNAYLRTKDKFEACYSVDIMDDCNISILYNKQVIAKLERHEDGTLKEFFAW